MSDRRCQWPDCGRWAGLDWEVLGRFHCGEHYFPALEQAFLNAYAAWAGTTEPTNEFKNLFSRHVEGLFPAGGVPQRLSQAKIEERGTSWKKTPVGVEFSIVRHLPAFRTGGFVKTVEQAWRFDLRSKELILIDQWDVEPRKLKLIEMVSRSKTPATARVAP
ncbi:MAG TPA: hypothetical protein VMV72_04010 [Verrucomicrobiae bacterium]|nr:hypothetical protein [Verrucomicrobiae bacterium]